MDELYQLMMGEQPDAAASAQAMARALRGDRQLAGINAVAGGGLGALGALQAAEAKQQSDLMEKGLAARLHYGQEARNAALARDAAKQQHEERLQTMRNEGALTRTMLSGQFAQRRAETPKPGSSASDDRLARLAKGEYDKLIREWDPAQAVRSAFGQSEQQNLNVIRALALAARAAGPNGKVNLNPVQQAELAAMGGRIATGGVPTLETMKHFDPSSAQKTAAAITSFVTGKPVTTGMTEWADSFLKMYEGEGEAAQNYVRSTRLKNAERFRRYAEMDPDSARRFLANMGMDKPHPRGYIDPETFEVRNFDANASAREIATGVVKVSTPEEARKLPKGTKFQTPDGRVLEVP